MAKRDWLILLVLLFLALGLFTTQSLVTRPQIIQNRAATDSIAPPQGVPPVLYHMFGSASSDFGNDSGAIGTWGSPGWSSIEQHDDQFNWDPIETYIAGFQNKTTTTFDGQTLKTPIGIGINLLVESCNVGQPTQPGVSPYNCENLLLPKWLIDKTGGAYVSQPEPQPSCGTAYFPKWNHPAFLEEFTELITEFGKKYDKDPRVSWIAINSGPYGEAISTMFNGRYKPDGTRCPSFNTDTGLGNFVIGTNPNGSLSQQGIIKIFRHAFPTKPLIVINTGSNYRKELAVKALEVSPPVGIKMHSWLPDGPEEFSENSHVNVFKWYQSTCEQRGLSGCITGLEHYYAANRPQTYWAMLFLITHNMTLFDIPTGHIQALKSLDNCQAYLEDGQMVGDCYPMWRLVESHLGRDVYTAPSVLTVLRDTSYIDPIYAGKPWDRRGEFGNWKRFLTLITEDNYSAEYPKVACTQLKPPYNKADPTRMYGCWESSDKIIARQTTPQKPSMDFIVDSRWPGKQTVGFNLEVTYVDNGSDKFRLSYRNQDNQLQTKIIQKTNTGRFIRHIFDLPDMAAKYAVSGTANFRLDDAGDGPEFIHLVHLIPKNWQAPKWDFNYSGPIPSPYPTTPPEPTNPQTTPAPTPTVTPANRPAGDRVCNQACNFQSAPCQEGLQCYQVDTGKGYTRSACRNPACPQTDKNEASCQCDTSPSPTPSPNSLPPCGVCDETVPCDYRCQQDGVKKVCRKVGDDPYQFYTAGFLQTNCAASASTTLPKVYCRSDSGTQTAYQCCLGASPNIFVPQSYWAYRTSGCLQPSPTKSGSNLIGRVCDQACDPQTAPCQNGLQCYRVDTGKGYTRSACRNPACPQTDKNNASCECPSQCSYSQFGDFNCDQKINALDQSIFQDYLANPDLPH